MCGVGGVWDLLAEVPQLPEVVADVVEEVDEESTKGGEGLALLFCFALSLLSALALPLLTRILRRQTQSQG